VIPKRDAGVSFEQIVAVLNSPVANAWFDAHCRKRKIVQSILRDLPFPNFDGVAASRVATVVRELEAAIVAKWREAEEGLFYDALIDTSDTAVLLSEVDSLVFEAYGLGREERRAIEKLVGSDRRPS